MRSEFFNQNILCGNQFFVLAPSCDEYDTWLFAGVIFYLNARIIHNILQPAWKMKHPLLFIIHKKRPSLRKPSGLGQCQK